MRVYRRRPSKLQETRYSIFTMIVLLITSIISTALQKIKLTELHLNIE